ncbi:MAG: sulfatase [Prosthecobacter sp.]|nr:sulfatase [Prosthecobacter sp.]
MKRLLALWLLGAGAVTQAAERPNILLLIGDNWGYPHAGVLGDPVVKTPVFDDLARRGTLFTHTFCPVPSCSPTRSSLLTGRAAHQLEDAASLWSRFPSKFRVFTDALAAGGYRVGYTGKGWSPGRYEEERKENPAGPKFVSFEAFLTEQTKAAPFFFWLGNTDTALNKWRQGTGGAAAGLNPALAKVPPCLPDAPEVRSNITDYLAGAQRMDADFGAALAALEKAGLAKNTVIVYTSDNGWQMPRGLANCYDTGTRVPMVVSWEGRVPAGRRVEDFVSLTDLAPTFLELAGLKPWPEMTGRSVVKLLLGKESDSARDHVFVERERHANVRKGDLSYPIRGIRTREFLYLRNLRPDRWPAGDPKVYMSVGDYGDVDGSLVKEHVLAHQDEPAMRRFFELSFAKRPGEELYDLKADPDQLVNVAGDPGYAAAKAELSKRVEAWMRETADPRVDPAWDAWDRYPYFGGKAKSLK